MRADGGARPGAPGGAAPSGAVGARRPRLLPSVMPLRRFLALLAALTLSVAAAQVCTGELRAALPAGSVTPGQAAALLLARAMSLVEPAYPEVRGGAGPVAGAGPAEAAVTWLHRRRLLPDGWSAEGHDAAAWAAMWEHVSTGYRVTPPALGAIDPAAMVDEAARALARLAEAVRPLPVFAVDADERVTFVAVIWNWTPAPRLLVLRPSDGLRLASERASVDAAAPVLTALSDCALRFERFAYAREDLALRLFVDQGASTLRVMASDPPRAGWPVVFDADEVVEVLTFRSPAVADLRVLSVAIEGPTPGLGAVLPVLLQLRTNVGLDGVLQVLALP